MSYELVNSRLHSSVLVGRVVCSIFNEHQYCNIDKETIFQAKSLINPTTMKKLFAFIITLMCSNICFSQTPVIPTKDVQISTAVLAAPEASREKAMVYGYSEKGEFVVLRSGTNEMVCLTVFHRA